MAAARYRIEARYANPQTCQCIAHNNTPGTCAGACLVVTRRTLAWGASLAGVCSSPVLLLLLLLGPVSLCLTCRLKATASSASWKATVQESPCAQHQHQHIHSHDVLHILTAPGDPDCPVAPPVALTDTSARGAVSPCGAGCDTCCPSPDTLRHTHTCTSLSLHKLNSIATHVFSHTHRHTHTHTNTPAHTPAPHAPPGP